MKKLNTIDHKAVEVRVFDSLDVVVQAEDHSYELKPLSWYLAQPWYGLRKYFYVSEGVDCDDFCTILKFELLRKHMKKSQQGAGKGGVTSYPALPVFQAKIRRRDGSAHWCLVVVAEEGTYMIERTETSIRLIPTGDYVEIYNIHI